ncbi:MAG: hypothetical protein U0163_21120 [Gemmatimonadaceae bacterium]
MPKICRSLREHAEKDVLVLMGGIVPPPRRAEGQGLGVAEVFGPGTPTATIVNFVKQWRAAQ